MPGRVCAGDPSPRPGPVSRPGGHAWTAARSAFPRAPSAARRRSRPLRDFRTARGRPASALHARPGTSYRRDSTPTITAIGLTRATIAKRSPTWRRVMTAPTPATDTGHWRGSGARHPPYLPGRKYAERRRHGEPIPRRPGASALPAGHAPPTCAPARLPRAAGTPGSARPPALDAASSGPRGGSVAVTGTAFPWRHCRRKPRAGGPGFASGGPAQGRRGRPRWLHEGPHRPRSQKYSEGEFGGRGCQQPRAWLPLPKSGLHGFRQRRYR
jgi:hypothetical protein